ncbi:hypothetical protein BDV98DRAFT_561274 [Pterulicium gracile]|uniref:Uncharacterized protein n=1 Tax=Pterulicium gracile TaxID=1884261 RepID=A0A5C3R2M0_9AGAR|nr:hypothetical protein BDV98DRAFT_561274 [Pterula gracilis]
MLLSSPFWYARSASPIDLGYLSTARKLQPHVFDTHGGVLGPPIARLVSRQIEHQVVFLALKQGGGDYNLFNDAYVQDSMHVVSLVREMASKSVELMAQVGFFRLCAKEMYDTICRSMTKIDLEATLAQAHSIIKTNALPLLAWTATAIHLWIVSDLSCGVLAGIYMGQKDPTAIDSKRDKVAMKYMKRYGV